MLLAQARSLPCRGKEAGNKVQQRSQQDLERRREQAAAAAEARMAALKVASRQQQLWSGSWPCDPLELHPHKTSKRQQESGGNGQGRLQSPECSVCR